MASKHVAAHRWADMLAGSVPDAERDAMNAHAKECSQCARAKARVQRASDSFPMMRQQATPELAWDSVRARVHWAVSKAKRGGGDPAQTGPHLPIRTRWFPPESYRRWPVAIAATAAVALGGYGVYRMIDRDKPAPVAAVPAERAPIAVELVANPITASVSRLAGDVMIDGTRAATETAFAKQLGQGTVLATGDGRIDLQFGDASAFALGPHSELELHTFDADTIELDVRGTIDLEVAPRAKRQRFLVVAGDKTVEVRGTRFTVKADRDGTLVECQHGLVAVRDAHGEIEVGTARKAFVKTDVAATKVVPLTADEIAGMTASAPWAMPGWDRIADGAPLAIVTEREHVMRVDNVELGRAPFVMRAQPGRHTIEVADRTGTWRRSGWVDLKAATPSHFDALELTEPTATPTVATRKQELSTRIDRTKLRQCTRRLAKSGLTDTFVQIEITVDVQGQVDVLNVLDSDLPSDTTACIHDAIAAIRFAPGAMMTWREKLTF
ncbi:MAG: FecR family protein [Kofleriaceae bacterium]